MRVSYLATVLGLFAVAPVARAQPAALRATPAPSIVIEDQFERSNDLAALRGQVVVLIYGDRAGAESCRRLGETIHVAFHPEAAGQPPEKARQAPVRPVAGAAPGVLSPNVLAVPIASIGGVPGPIKSIIRREFRKESPAMPVWLDFGNRMKELYGLKAGAPNVVVIDPAGNLRHTAAGSHDESRTARLVQMIEDLRREAVMAPANR